MARALSRPGMTGHHQCRDRLTADFDPLDPRHRPLALREIALARALYRCGDKDGLGESILKRYTTDLRGHFARHAAAVLTEGSIAR